MGKWSDILTLITVTPPAEETDEQGFYLPPIETWREVFCNKRSVGYSEFYKSAQAGRLAELKFIVRSEEYNGESLVEFEGKRYKVMRLYETTSLGGSHGTRTSSGEFTELTVTDLTEREDLIEDETPDPDTPEPEEGGGDG